ncbi:L,D-transpeptidase family protein [Ornithinimicrobium avium]|uniref:L,D-transpeptidase family protein n=1 Tax=Ornithinimicrobium avium TaxID=2283195 RepID=UPI0013B40851|nr:L,D-transpeptidase family protein [Ornithinimicrobium avium]
MRAADGDFGELTQQAVWAVQKHNGLERDAVVGPITRAALDAGSVPAPVGGSGSRVEVHLAAQLLLVVRGGRTRRVLSTSTGSGEYYWLDGRRYRATTPTGSWRVYSTWSQGWQSGPLGPMWRPMYYDGGFAVHGSSSIPPWPASHGCSRLSTRAMDMLWSTGYLQLGTRVGVVDA